MTYEIWERNYHGQGTPDVIFGTNEKDLAALIMSALAVIDAQRWYLIEVEIAK